MAHEFKANTLVKADPDEIHVVIPDGIKVIDQRAFREHPNMETLEIPESVTRIGIFCFANAKKLRTVVIRGKIKNIPNGAFFQCGSLEEVTLPESVELIHEGAFSGCESLRKINLPPNLKRIDGSAFSGCKKLPEIIIPNKVEKIDSLAFFGCEKASRIVIPESVKSIGSQAFDFCSGVPEVSIPESCHLVGDYKGRRTNFAKETKVNICSADGKTVSVLDRDSTSRMKPSKMAADKTAKISSPTNGKIYQYDEVVSFDLPAGYDFLDKTDEKGNRTVTIGVNPKTENGETTYDKQIVVTTVESDHPGEDVLESIEKSNPDIRMRAYRSTEPRILTICTETVSSVLGVSFVIRLFALNIRLSESKALSLRMMGGGAGEGANEIDEEWSMISSLVPFVMINGKKITNNNGEGKQNNKTEQRETGIDNSWKFEDHVLTVGDRWQMTLPSGWRITENKDDQGRKLGIRQDRGDLGRMILADTVTGQNKANASLSGDLAAAMIGGTKLASGIVLRDDDRISVTLFATQNTDQPGLVEIRIREKKPVNVETFLYLMLYSVENLAEALEKIKNNDYQLEHPFGREWLNRWSAVLKIALSIRALQGEENSETFSDEAQHITDVSYRMPIRFKQLKGGKDEADFWYPAKGKPSLKDIQDNQNDCYIKLEKGNNSNDIFTTKKEFIKTLSMNMAWKLLTPFAIAVHEHIYTEGYTAVFLMALQENTAVNILTITTKTVALMRISSDTGKHAGELTDLASMICDSIRIDGCEEEACGMAFPPTPEILREHCMLVESGSYTTRRSADFVAQPIRMLLKKCGNQKEEAYRLMELKGDKYSLDREAISLAKVFRLDEKQFDEYKDTEALIRKGMFQKARAFHTLRALAWEAHSLSERKGVKLCDLSAHEVEAIGDYVQKYNSFIYDGDTYCAGLCNHYDWHVFYVPDAYLDSDYSGENDLRYLTGKENRGGNSVSFFMPGMSGNPFGGMNQINNLISRNEETLESLEALRYELEELLPVMQTIHDHLLEGRDRSKKLEGPLADALTAWCALAIAAKEPFYSEEAADTPEADAALEEPLERPTDKLDDKPARKAKPEPKKDEKKETPKKSPAKQASKAGKAMKGASNDASYEQYLPKGTKLTPEETRYMTIIARLLTEKKKVNINDIAFETNETIEETKRVLSELRKKRVLGVTTYGNLEMWEPERRKKAATETVVPVSKKTGSRTETFYKRFTFELPDGYDLEREDDHRCVFYLNEHDDGTGTLVYDCLNTMTLEKFTDLKPGESPVQRIRNSLYFTKDWYEISSEPETGILTEQGTFYKAGEPVDTYSMMYLYQLSDTEVLVFREKVMEGTKKDLSYHLDKYEHFLQAIGNICVDGKPVPATGITAAELWDKVRAYRDVNYEEPGESRKKEEKKIKTKPAAKPEKIDYYDGTYGFALPAGYELEWFTEDGNRYCDIVHGPYYKENGKKDYQFSAQLSVNTANDALAGERPLQMIHRNNQDALFSTVSSNPNAEIMVKTLQINALGQTVKLYVIWLIVEKNTREFFLVHHQSILDEDRSKQLESYRGMIIAANALRINGKPIAELKESPETLMKKMPLRTDGNLHTLQGNVELNISVNGEHVGSTTIYGDSAGNIHSRKRYTADMMPPGTDNPEKMAEELNDMDPEQAEKMLNLLIGMNELNDALSDLNDTVSGKVKEPTTEQKTVNSRPVQTTNKSTQTTNGNVRIMDFGGATILDGMDYMADTDPRPMVIPEGVTQIGDSYFSHCHMESVTLPSTMRILGHHVFSNCANLKKVELNEGLEKIDGLVFADSPLMTEITLPDSIRWIDNDAFLVEFSVSNPRSNMTVRLSGNLARYLVRNNEYPDIPAIRAKEFIIEGRSYRSLEDYVRKPGSGKPVKTESPGRNAPPSQETDEQKQQRRNAILKQIKDLETERDAAKGLFSGFKKNKLQKRIDELKDKLRQL